MQLRKECLKRNDARVYLSCAGMLPHTAVCEIIQQIEVAFANTEEQQFKIGKYREEVTKGSNRCRKKAGLQIGIVAPVALPRPPVPKWSIPEIRCFGAVPLGSLHRSRQILDSKS